MQSQSQSLRFEIMSMFDKFGRTATFNSHYASTIDFLKVNEFPNNHKDMLKQFPMLCEKMVDEKEQSPRRSASSQVNDSLTTNLSEDANEGKERLAEYQQIYDHYYPVMNANEEIQLLTKSLEQADPFDVLRSAYEWYRVHNGILEEKQFRDKLLMDLLFHARRKNKAC